ncbi:VanZ family protein [Halomonas huangheensis]|nr:VanZ family protein [Halomonas huangheensis]
MTTGIRTLLDRRRMWRWLAILAALIIAVGSLMPGSELPDSLPSDKINHLLGYAGLAALIALSGRRYGWAAVLAVGFGVVIEWAQLHVPGRSGADLPDIAANSVGALLGVGSVAWLARRCRSDQA